MKSPTWSTKSSQALVRLLKSAHQVDREYRVIRALRDQGVPLPETYLLCRDDSVIGSDFFLME